MALTALGVAKLIREGRRGHYADAQGSGLYLKVSGPGRASWCMRFKRNGILREMGLGSCRILTLADARDKAIAARKILLDGRDPIEERRADRVQAELEATRSISFEEVAEALIRSREDTWSEKYARTWRQSLRDYAYPVLGRLPIGAIGTAQVVEALEPHWSQRRDTLGRVRGRISEIFAFAKSRGLREGDDPASWSVLKYALNRQKAPVRHFQALDYRAIPQLMAELADLPDFPARALRLTILCASRTNETLGATWDEFDLDGAIWTIPGGRMKTKKEHRVPLSTGALAVLQECRALRESARVFPGQRWSPDPKGAPLNSGAMWGVLAMMRPGTTVHGTARSSFADWAAERTNYSYEIRELCLAHIIHSAVARAYNRSICSSAAGS